MKFTPDLLLLVLALLFLFSLTWVYRKQATCYQEPMLEKLRADLIKIDPRVERLQFYPANESYTEDKEKIYICLKDENGQYYPYNMLMEVCLHEVSHALTTVIDKQHVTPEFNNMFTYLRKRAASMNLYNPDEPTVPNYCTKK